MLLCCLFCLFTSLLIYSCTPPTLPPPDLPEVSFTENSMMELPLNGMLTLTCNYVAVPMPSVAWYLNRTHFLDPDDPRITVTLTSSNSVLTVQNLTRDEGGLYSCSFTNDVGTAVGNVTTLLILSKILSILFRTFSKDYWYRKRVLLYWSNVKAL